MDVGRILDPAFCIFWGVVLVCIGCAAAKPAPKYPCDRELIELQADRASERRTLIQSGACPDARTVSQCPALKQLYERWAKVFDRWERCSSKP